MKCQLFVGRFRLSKFRFVDILVCRHLGLSLLCFVDVLSIFWSVKIFGLLVFWFVNVLVCWFSCRGISLLMFWLVICGFTHILQDYLPALGRYEYNYSYTVIHSEVMQSINSLPSDAIWWHRSQSILAKVKAWCLLVSSHYLNQCWPDHQWGLGVFT